MNGRVGLSQRAVIRLNVDRARSFRALGEPRLLIRAEVWSHRDGTTQGRVSREVVRVMVPYRGDTTSKLVVDDCAVEIRRALNRGTCGTQARIYHCPSEDVICRGAITNPDICTVKK